jgi:NTP pyrophosphatase (non-canonical NTP hydrolase)
MKMKQYQDLSARTLNASNNEGLILGALGLAGEAGEVVEPIKKHLFHGDHLPVPQIAEELGDVLWYVAALATTLGLSLDDIAQQNIDKLMKRRPPRVKGETS